MPGRGGKGKSSKRGGSKRAEMMARTRELIFKTEDQVYGKVLKMLGQGRISVACTDSVKRTCLICGRMRNRVYVRPQDVVLISLRAGMTADDKADVVHKYTPEEARALRKRGDIPEKFLGEMNEDATVVEAAPDAGGGVEASADDAGEAFEFDEADIDDL